MSKTFWKKYWKYSDAGHGWLQVPLDQLHPDMEISKFSYVDTVQGYAYLEEDSDMWKFLSTFDETPEVVPHDHGDRSWIRDLPRYEN
jgi:hypothetical protein